MYNGIYEHSVTEERPMNTTILSYPGFQALPKGVKQMLLASETYFFENDTPRCADRHYVTRIARNNRRARFLWRTPLMMPGLAFDVPICARGREESARRDQYGGALAGAV
jgi:hypothetical protein